MKKIIMSLIGITLFVAGYQHTRRQAEYVTAQSALTNANTYGATSTSTTANLKSSLPFRLMKLS